MSTPYYGMFTDEGNARVHDIVEIALLGKMSWPSVDKMLEDLSTFDGFREASDTAVREEVFAALSDPDGIRTAQWLGRIREKVRNI